LLLSLLQQEDQDQLDEDAGEVEGSISDVVPQMLISQGLIAMDSSGISLLAEAAGYDTGLVESDMRGVGAIAGVL
jgi:hypothetical protein